MLNSLCKNSHKTLTSLFLLCFLITKFKKRALTFIMEPLIRLSILRNYHFSLCRSKTIKNNFSQVYKKYKNKIALLCRLYHAYCVCQYKFLNH